MTRAAAPGHDFELLGSADVAQWSSGLCDCCDDTCLCCLTCFFPCITFGQIAEIVDKGSSSCGVSGALYAVIGVLTGLQCIYSCTYRTKLRTQYSLPGTPCADFCVHCWCEPCALCQMHRELTNRGFDMNIGWHANMERQSAATGVPVPPVPHPGMSRSV